MNRTDKERFIRSLCNSVRDDAIERVKHMPDAWDGIELREYLARQFQRESVSINRRRLREFRGEVATRFGL